MCLAPLSVLLDDEIVNQSVKSCSLENIKFRGTMDHTIYRSQIADLKTNLSEKPIHMLAGKTPMCKRSYSILFCVRLVGLGMMPENSRSMIGA